MRKRELTVGRAARVEGGSPRQVWQILELTESEALEGVEGVPRQPDWRQVPGTADFETKEEAKTAMKHLESTRE